MRKGVHSLTWKWTIGAAIAIFFTYSMFTVAIYQGFTNMMMAQEHTNVNDTLLSIIEKLKNGPEHLTKDLIHQKLRTEAYEASLEEEVDGEADTNENFIYAQLFEKGVSVSIYNADQVLLYQSVPTDIRFKTSEFPIIKELMIDGEDGLVGVAPIVVSNEKVIGYVQVTNKLLKYHALSSKVLMAMLLLGAFALIVSGLLGYLLALNFLKPLKTMTRTMNDIRQDMQSTSRMPVTDGEDEISNLTTIFNEMLDNIQRYMEQQQRFVEDASHELRTPVAIMEGHLKLLNRWGKEDPEVLNESLNASLQEIERMKNLVQEMLDLSRAEQVEMFYQNKVTPIKEVIDQTYTNFSMIYPDFTFNMDNELTAEMQVKIYRNHLEQILIILLDNAVKYSTDRKEIHISASQDGHAVQIAIQDFGEGVSSEDLQRIFNRFFRVDKARSRQKGGNGLGLSIAKQLIDGYQGSISADSVVGHGTTFRISLPLAVIKK